MTHLLLVALGGALGSVARHVAGAGVHRLAGGAFPVGTLTVNVIGSFLVVVVVHASATRGLLSAEARLFLGTGVMGGFTTYSAFNFETIALLQSGAVTLAVLNVAVTVAGCLLAGGAGLMAARWLLGA